MGGGGGAVVDGHTLWVIFLLLKNPLYVFRKHQNTLCVHSSQPAVGVLGNIVIYSSRNNGLCLQKWQVHLDSGSSSSSDARTSVFKKRDFIKVS